VLGISISPLCVLGVSILPLCVLEVSILPLCVFEVIYNKTKHQQKYQFKNPVQKY
jgi:hypothetical protein